MKKAKAILLFLAINVISNYSFSQIIYTGEKKLIGQNIEIYEDKTTTTDINTIINNKLFTQNKTAVINLDLTASAFWLKFSIQNNTSNPQLLINIDYPLLDSCILYEVNKDKISTTIITTNKSLNSRKYKYGSFIFDLNIPYKETKNYFLRVTSSEQTLVPPIIGNINDIVNNEQNKDIINSLYIGILLIMFFYNLFIYFSTKDRSYLYYVLYILFIGLTQTTLSGYTAKYLWPNSPHFNKIVIILMPVLAGITLSLFIKRFLQINNQEKKTKIINVALYIIITLYTIIGLLRCIGFDRLSYRMTDFTAILLTIVVYIAAIKNIKKNRSVRFFLIAWSTLFIGVILFVLRNLNILPYNNFTTYTMQFGTAVEVMLIAFALADRINVMRKETEQSRARELATAKENEKLVQEQNIVLEKQVAERTVELQKSNQNLSETLVTLKETQAQLVQAEKMSSLGILTAGVAHEINNPINFVSSNLKPLELDITELLTLIEKYELLHKTPAAEIPKLLQEIDSLKQELDLPFLTEEIHTILKTIGDGAKRTADIVQGLRNFSRLDESDFKNVNIHEGIDSTLMILRSHIPNNVQIIKQYNADGNIDCFPSQLNQAFMNIVMNALQAIQDKKTTENETITITTNNDDNFIYIHIADTGPGMTDEVKNRMFDPFFTTKDVGEGTGLGLSIVHKIIEKHQGKIDVESTIGKGTVFNIQLPRKLSNPS